MKKILIGMFITITLSFAESIGTDSQPGLESAPGGAVNSNFGTSIGMNQKTKLKTPIKNIFETTQWDLFLREFEINLKVGICCREGDPLSCLPGLKAKMIEPIGYFESTKKPLKFPFADIDLGGKADLAKGNSFFNVFEEGGGNRSVNYNVHMISLPILGNIFKKTMTTFCFDRGGLDIPYLSEFDPTWKKDFYFSKMVPHMIVMFSPQGLLSTVFSCIASEVSNSITMGQDGITGNFGRESMASFTSFEDRLSEKKNLDGEKMGEFTSASLEKMNLVRNTLYYADGCSGFGTIGGYVDGEDPILDATSTFHTVMNSLHGLSAMSPVGFFKKQSNVGLVMSEVPRELNINSIPDTMCRPKKFAMGIPSQYILQLAYPTVGSAREIGASAVTVSTAKNLPASDGTVYSVWKRRDYYAWAYFCPGASEFGEKEGKGK